MEIRVKVIRTAMAGGIGTSYDVYWPISVKEYRTIVGHCYATVICDDGGQWYRTGDLLRSRAIDSLPALTVERWDAFKRIEAVARRLEYRIGVRAFPELSGTGERRLPMLWADWKLPSAARFVTVRFNARNSQELALVAA